ncbi:zinc-dependent alcohol dehydrogenase family protein [Streptomyces sp. NPDC058308]|uniref:zinc-dependent alcohol dehydrogenase family protein n=1 Tax=Streptomyces sp. NPDC058308 TaxID=3346440 RepID=UPI0036EDCD95
MTTNTATPNTATPNTAALNTEAPNTATPNTARTVLFDETGGPDVLRVEEVPLPAPGPGEVLVRVEALGLNRAEALFRAGAYYYQPALPGSRLGYEAAGTVEAVGPGVSAHSPGDAVLTGPGIEMSAQGVYADRVVLPATAVVARPAGLDAVTGAATWLTYSTAYGGMLETGGLRPGDHVVVTAASSGVGVAALQTAARIGAVPIAVTRTGEKRRQLLDNGAALVVASDTDDVVKEVRRFTGDKGAELIFDAVGGPGLAELARSATTTGTVVVYGSLDRRLMAVPLNWPMTVHGYANTHLSSTPEGLRRINAFIASGLRDGTFRPVVGEVFEGLESIRDAHRLMESNEHVGKIVVRL